MDNIVSTRDIIKCLLCYDALCSKACPNNLDPAKILRSLRFKNYKGALENVTNACINCSAPCQKKCILENEINIKRILINCQKQKKNLI